MTLRQTWIVPYANSMIALGFLFVIVGGVGWLRSANAFEPQGTLQKTQTCVCNCNAGYNRERKQTLRMPLKGCSALNNGRCSFDSSFGGLPQIANGVLEQCKTGYLAPVKEVCCLFNGQIKGYFWTVPAHCSTSNGVVVQLPRVQCTGAPATAN